MSKVVESTGTKKSHLPGQGQFREIRPEDVKWMALPEAPEASTAVLVGDPAKQEPFVIRVKVPAGLKIMPHKHSEDRIYTIVSGVFYIGLGNEFDEEKLRAYAPGSIIVLPGDQSHFHWAKSGEYVSQIFGIGPAHVTNVGRTHH